MDNCKCEGQKVIAENIHICPNRHNCYRYRGISDKYMQSYFSEAPFDLKGNCTEYWPLEKGMKLEDKDGCN